MNSEPVDTAIKGAAVPALCCWCGKPAELTLTVTSDEAGEVTTLWCGEDLEPAINGLAVRVALGQVICWESWSL